MTAKERTQAMIDELTAILVDAEKFDKGNGAAGTRVRKAFQGIKVAAQDGRQYVQETKNSR